MSGKPIPEAVRAKDALRIVRTAIQVCEERDRPAMAEDLESVQLYIEQTATLTAAQQQGQAVACRWPSCECPNGTAECPKRTAPPPSVPVGVEAVLAKLREGLGADGTLYQQVEGMIRALAQQPAAHPAITHCDNCGCDWLDNGLNPAACPYCKQPAAVDEAMERLRLGSPRLWRADLVGQQISVERMRDILAFAIAGQQQGGTPE